MFQVGDFVKLARTAPYYMLRYAGLRGEIVHIPNVTPTGRQRTVVVRWYSAARQRTEDKRFFSQWLVKC
jgi:hypothetical protein